MVAEDCYFADFIECRYIPTMRFTSPSNWNADIILRCYDWREMIFYEDVFEFGAIKGHWYEIRKAQTTT